MSAGTRLVEQSQIPERFWRIRRGIIGMSAVDGSGRELGCVLRGPDSIVGLECLVHQVSPYAVWAHTDVVACGVSRSAVASWLGPRNSPLGSMLAVAVEEAGRRALERIDIGGTAVSRVARALLRQYEDGGRSNLGVSQRLLARTLGMKPETLSRALAQLRREKALTAARELTVGDLQKLRDFGLE